MVRRPSEADLRLWREVARSIAPLKRRPSAAKPPPALLAPPAAAPAPPAPRPPRPRPAPASAARALDMDRRQALRLKRGHLPVEAAIDLHGLTQAEAHAALARFIAGAAQAEKRCLLIVTGKGAAPGGSGVLKAMTPRWLDEPPLRRSILAYAPAAPRHGGAGALYVLLKRKRPA